MSSRLIAVVLLVALIAVASMADRSAAQKEQAEAYSYQADVLVENATNLGANMIDPVSAVVARRITKQLSDNGRPFPISIHNVALAPTGGKLVSGQEVYSLQISWGGTTIYDKDSPALWESVRSAMEKSLRTIQAKVALAVTEERTRQLERLARLRDGYKRQLNDASATLDALSRDGVESPLQARKELSATQTQLRQLQLEQIGVQARRKAIEKRIDELRALAESQVNDDPVIKELQTLVDIQERRLKLVLTNSPDVERIQREIAGAQEKIDQYKSTTTSDWNPDLDVRHRRLLNSLNRLRGELNVARAAAPTEDNAVYQETKTELVSARISLIKAQREVADRASGASLQALNNELSALIVQAAEIEEKTEAVAALTETLRERSFARVWVEMNAVTDRVQTLRNVLTQTELKLTELENNPLPKTPPVSLRPLEEALLGEDP